MYSVMLTQERVFDILGIEKRKGENKMENGNDIFVKVNYKVKGTGNNIKCDAKMNYIDATGASKYIIGGGFTSKEACSFMFKAKNLQEAQNIMNENPILKKWKLRYNEIKYDLIIVPGF